MTHAHMTRLIATAAGLVGSAAFVAFASLPGVAQTAIDTSERNSETRTYPGPGETPSGSPSVPGTSTYDDPGAMQEDSQPDQEARRENSPAPQSPSTIELYERGRDGIVDPAEIPADSDQEPYTPDMNSALPTSPSEALQIAGQPGSQGPSAVPGEGVPGPGETPSGSPSVPGVSDVDDPGLQESDSENRPSIERDARVSPDVDGTTGPSAVPSEGIPGPSETPSGSPSVPGVSIYDDPNEEPNSEMMSPGQTSGDESRQDGPSAVPGEGVPVPSETPSGSPSVPGVSGADDPGISN